MVTAGPRRGGMGSIPRHRQSLHVIPPVGVVTTGSQIPPAGVVTAGPRRGGMGFIPRHRQTLCAIPPVGVVTTGPHVPPAGAVTAGSWRGGTGSIPRHRQTLRAIPPVGAVTTGSQIPPAGVVAVGSRRGGMGSIPRQASPQQRPERHPEPVGVPTGLGHSGTGSIPRFAPLRIYMAFARHPRASDSLGSAPRTSIKVWEPVARSGTPRAGRPPGLASVPGGVLPYATPVGDGLADPGSESSAGPSRVGPGPRVCAGTGLGGVGVCVRRVR